MNDKLLGLMRFFFAQCVFNNKCFYSACNRMEELERTRKIATIWISSITIIIIVLQLCCYQINPKEEFTSYIKGTILILNFLGLAATASSLLYELFTKEDVTEKKLEYKRIAEDFKDLRDQLMILIEAYMSNSINEESARIKLEELVSKYDSIAKYGPQTNYNDYKNAQKELGIGDSDSEGFTWPDDQINRLLPKPLHL